MTPGTASLKLPWRPALLDPGPRPPRPRPGPNQPGPNRPGGGGGPGPATQPWSATWDQSAASDGASRWATLVAPDQADGTEATFRIYQQVGQRRDLVAELPAVVQGGRARVTFEDWYSEQHVVPQGLLGPRQRFDQVWFGFTATAGAHWIRIHRTARYSTQNRGTPADSAGPAETKDVTWRFRCRGAPDKLCLSGVRISAAKRKHESFRDVRPRTNKFVRGTPSPGDRRDVGCGSHWCPWMRRLSDNTPVITETSMDPYPVGGGIQGNVSLGGKAVSSKGQGDPFVAKISPAGAVLWATAGGGTEIDAGYGVAVDSSGSSYMTGRFQGTASFGSTKLTSKGKADIFVAKLNPSGAFSWAARAGGTEEEQGHSVAVGASGQVHVTGQFQGSAAFGSTTLTSNGSYDAFVARLSAGGAFQWALSAGGSGWEGGRGIAVDSQGNTLVAGGFSGTVKHGGLTLTAKGGADVLLAKVNGSGLLVAAESAGGSGADGVSAVVVDAWGNVLLAGEFESAYTMGGVPITSAGGRDLYVWKRRF